MWVRSNTDAAVDSSVAWVINGVEVSKGESFEKFEPISFNFFSFFSDFLAAVASLRARFLPSWVGAPVTFTKPSLTLSVLCVSRFELDLPDFPPVSLGDESLVDGHFKEGGDMLFSSLCAIRSFWELCEACRASFTHSAPELSSLVVILWKLAKVRKTAVW